MMHEVKSVYSSNIAKRRSWDARYGVYIFIVGAAIIAGIYGK